jgi:hypothetical protein
MSTNIPPRLCDAPTAPCDSAGHRKGSSQNTSVAAASNKSWAIAQSSPWTDWRYRLSNPARAQANVQAHAETGKRRKPVSPNVDPNPRNSPLCIAASFLNCIQERGVCREPATRQRGGQNGDTPNPVSDYRTAIRQLAESGVMPLGGCRAVVTKRVYVSSYVGARRRADVGIRAPAQKGARTAELRLLPSASGQGLMPLRWRIELAGHVRT